MKRTIHVPQVSNSKVVDEIQVSVERDGIQLTITKGKHGGVTSVLLTSLASYDLVDAIECAQTYFPNAAAPME